MTLQLIRRRNLIPLAVLVILTAVVMSMSSSTASGNGFRNGQRYEVTITNITKGQILSPVVIATHRSNLDPIFELGSPASPQLAGVAEDADLDPFIAMLENNSRVGEVVTLTGAGGPIMPGETASVEISAKGLWRQLSLAGMLVTTNDTFVGLSGVSLPLRGSKTHYSPGYDAGSEANNEDCDYIPGPPCGNPGVRDTEGAEGYVYIGNGVHGIADLDPAEHDWNNPTAKITIKRVSGR